MKNIVYQLVPLIFSEVITHMTLSTVHRHLFLICSHNRRIISTGPFPKWFQSHLAAIKIKQRYRTCYNIAKQIKQKDEVMKGTYINKDIIAE
jgi:hypothetical protein